MFSFHQHNEIIYSTADCICAVGGVRHCFSTRKGGISPAPYDSLNFAGTTGDTQENIVRNFRLLGKAVGFDEKRVVCCRQIHGKRVEIAKAEHGGKIENDLRPFDADGLITNEPDLPLAVFGADCPNAVFCDPVTHAVGACHAGWRGTALGIVAEVIEAMARTYGSKAEDIRVAISPAIGKCCFETDENVPLAMREALGADVEAMIEKTGEKYHVDLKEINRLWLLRTGILPEHIAVHPHCTACNPDLYWSHRKMGLSRGGMTAVILRTKEENA